MTLTYTVFAVDPTSYQREVQVDGETLTATVEGLAVQLVSGRGTITLNLTKGEAAGHPFVVGETVAVTFGGVA